MADASAPPVFEIKKYPNRRFYDVTRSRHVTLNDLYELVRGGSQIHVCDSRTGADITNLVLTQIILEHDPPKLDLFPASLLHQAIQSNQQMVRGFIEQYFAKAMDAFVQSRRQFEDFLQRSGFSPLSPAAPFDWVRMLVPGASNGPTSSGGRSNDAGREMAEVDEATDVLRQEVAALREEVSRLRAGSATRPSRRAAKKEPRRTTRRPRRKRS